MDFNMEKFSFSFFLFVFFFFFSFTFSFFYEVDDSIHFACAFHLKFLILNCKCLTNSLATYWNQGIQTDVRLKKDIPPVHTKSFHHSDCPEGGTRSKQ